MRILVLVALLGCKSDKPAPAPAPPPAVAPAPALSPVDQAASAGTIEAWDAAAKQLDATVAACATATPACLQAARDAVTAHGRALKLEFLNDPGHPLTPVPLPARATALIAACDVYAKRADTADPELPAIELIAAQQQASYGWLDLAIPRYEEILREHRDSDAAGLAVAPLLDALRRQGRGADLRRWVDSLRADTRFLSSHPDLGELLESLHALP